MMRLTTKLLVALIWIGLALALTAPLVAQAPSCQGDVYNCFVLRVDDADYDLLLQTHSLNFEQEVRPGSPKLVLVTGPASLLPETTLALVQADPATIGFEMVGAAGMTEGATGAGVDTAAPSFQTSLTSTGTYTGPETAYFSAPLWNGYMSQPAVDLMNIDDAHADPRPESVGLGVVAIIDTGVDPDHPALQGALLPGYDFILDQPGDASEWNALDPVVHATTQDDLELVADQSYTTIVEGNGTAFVEQSYTTIVEQSYTTIVEQSYTGIVDGKDLPPGFGHGTMVAGLVRLVAPGAMIMPLRVFDEYGHGDLGQIIRAIYYAVDNGADVINMSFSTSAFSSELLQAIQYANQAGVVCVSSVGNEGLLGLTFPSAFGSVIGVASTSHADVKSDFTNFGIGLVFLGATGEGLVTAFPGGLYAAAWGTSFSSALVSGTVALLHEELPGGTYDPVTYYEAAQALVVSAKRVQPFFLGAGRLDVDQALNCGPTGGSCN